ncbi:MAG: calcium/sodium antiporter [Bacteroidetes bacterium]|nr:calcium/sodium antiporter [Bacteroidota bacterium]MCH8524446.1 calcium/sodium antiporter [Balneolales bacterium]
MILTLIQLIAGFALLTYGAARLVDGSSALALKAGLTPLVVGITVVAFGTSAPELVVSIRATIAGNSEIAIGNVIGSNIANIALILGVTAVIRPMMIHASLLKVDIPLMMGITFLASVFIINEVIGRLEGAILFAGLIAYIVYNILRTRSLPKELVEQLVEEPDEDAVAMGTGKIWLLIVFGMALLIAGGELLVSAAVSIARDLGISEAVIGITIVSVGTSLPELATSAVAAIKKEADIAVGNIIGSNVFNLLSILGITGLIHPLDSSAFGLVDLSVMLGVTIVIWPLMRRGFEINRLEGALLLCIYGGYMAWLLL